jgi:hypothetical protein
MMTVVAAESPVVVKSSVAAQVLLYVASSCGAAALLGERIGASFRNPQTAA